ncbi:MAG: hypothetical protein QOK06_737 [Acidimicrobiaceae bacterium]
MYFHVMPISPAAVLAADACERMRWALLGFADSHEHAADLARLDWCGPHRDSFEVSFAAIQGELVRHAAAMSRLASDIEDAAG